FAELLGGGVLLTAGISGQSIADVFSGDISLKPFDAAAPGQVAAGGGPAAGGPGAANPFAAARGLRLGRTDQGVDATMQPGSPIGAIAPSRVVRIDPNW